MKRKLLDSILALPPEELEAMAPTVSPGPGNVPNGMVRFELFDESGEVLISQDLHYRIEGRGLGVNIVLDDNDPLEYDVTRNVTIVGYRIRDDAEIITEHIYPSPMPMTAGSALTMNFPASI